MSEHEFNTLRTEILQDYSEIAQYNCVLYTVIAAVLAYAIKYDNYLICLIPYLVILPIHLMCEARREGICKIGAYLNVFTGKDYMWEKRVHELDRDLVKKRFSVINRIKRSKMHYQYYLIAACSSAAAIHKIGNSSFDDEWKIVRIVIIVLIMLVSFVIIYKTTIFTQMKREYYIKKWEKLKNSKRVDPLQHTSNSKREKTNQ